MKINNITLSAIGVLGLFCVIGTACTSSKDAALGNGLFARITTSRGDIVVRLEYQKTPITVCNFVALAEGKMNVAGNKRFYDGLTFHRVISRANGDGDDFMIQTGCPQGNGMGGPGYRFPDEFDPSLRHDLPGVLSMANAGPGTNGSQIYITIVPTPWLDQRHTVFGRVVEGMDVVTKIRQGDELEKVRIIRNGPGAKEFKADKAAFDALLNRLTAAENAANLEQRAAALEQIEQSYPTTNETASGIKYDIQKHGDGRKPVQGEIVSVKYTGRLPDGNVFDSSDFHGAPFEFYAGYGEVIAGWDESVLDMQLNEKRLVVIPPELAYGNQAVGGRIPANSFLIFEMELVDIQSAE